MKIKAIFVKRQDGGRKLIGTLGIMDDNGTVLWNCEVVSGSRGLEPAPEGMYEIPWIDDREYTEDKEPYSKFGIAWFAYIKPKFKTKREYLGFHIDGRHPGSAGCVVYDPDCIEMANKPRDLIREALGKQKTIPFEVEYQLLAE